jgi:hypothetical protein
MDEGRGGTTLGQLVDRAGRELRVQTQPFLLWSIEDVE